MPEEAGHHAHESPSVMTLPLVVLATGAFFAGAILEPFTHWFSQFLGTMPSLGLIAAGSEKEVGTHFDWSIAIVSTLLALMGAGLAFLLYGRGVEKLPPVLEPVFALSRDRLYVEDAYEAALVKPAVGMAFLAKVFDGFLDGMARLISSIPRVLGQLTRPIQNGLVQFYALSMALGLIVLISFTVFRITR